jgi:holin-like protein
MVFQCAIIFLCLAVGEALVCITGCKVPGSIIGMLLLTLLLQCKLVKPESIKGICGVLLSNLGFFFVPAGVGLMLYLDLIRAEWFPILVAALVSTVIVLVVTGLTHQFMRRHGNNRK